MERDTSLIICSRDRATLLAETVASVLAGFELPAELIVVDQSRVQHAQLAARAEAPGSRIRYVWTDTVGASRASNLGIALARHDIVVLIDDDILVERTWFSALVDALVEAGEQSVVTGQVLEGAAEVPGAFAPSTKSEARGAVYAGRLFADVLYTGNMAMYRSVVARVGGFDERLGPGARFQAAKDNEFAYRLLEHGYRIVYVPSAVVLHRAWRSRTAYLPLRWRYGRGQGAFYAKHARLRDLHMLRRLVHDLRRHAGQCVRRVPRDWLLAAGDVAFILGLLYGFGEWMLTERGRRSGRYDGAVGRTPVPRSR